MNDLLKISNLNLEIAGKRILEDVNFNLGRKEVVALVGANGSGKSSFLRALMGFEGYYPKSGNMMIGGKEIGNLSIDERVGLGLSIMHQNPVKIRGIKLFEILKNMCYDEDRIDRCAEELGMTGFLDRELNMNLSGGEMKRSELLQLFVQNKEILLLDEPDSGVDSENLRIMGVALKKHLEESGKSALIITHTGRILKYLDVNKIYSLDNKKIREIGKDDAKFN